jgi:hypothetical protein
MPDAPTPGAARDVLADGTPVAVRRSPLAAWLGGIGLIALFLALRWNSYDTLLTRDEGEYSYAAQLLQHGLAPYEHSFLQKPPMVAYSYALAGLTAPGVFWFPRIVAYCFVALATALLGYVARREFGIGYALPAMWVMTLLIPQPAEEQFTANTEMFMLLPLMGTVALYVWARQGGGGGVHWLAAGALAMVTLCYKYTALPLLVFIFAAWSFEEWRANAGRLRSLMRHWALALLGAVAAGGIILGFFLARDGGRRLWDCTVTFNRYYAAASLGGGLWRRLGMYGAQWWILFVAPLPALLKRPPRAWFWFGAFLVSWLTTASSDYGHYYITVMPFWALIVAVGIRAAGDWLAAFPGALRWPTAGLTAIVVLLLSWPDAHWLFLSKARFTSQRLGAWRSFMDSPEAARRIDDLTAPDDPVFVAGSEPQILCYARRFSPSRFDIMYPMMIPTPLAKGYQDEAIAELRARPPRVIVLVQEQTSWLTEEASPPDFVDFLAKLLNDDYEMVGGTLYDNDGATTGRWQEPLTRDEAMHASVVLYQRKSPAEKR